MKSVSSVVMLTLVFLIVACQEKAMNPAMPSGPDFSVTPMENEEAELLALHLSGELIAPIGIYEKVKSELEIIRRQWSDSIEHLDIKFHPFYKVSSILFWVPSAIYDSMENNSYSVWDSLNNFYPVEKISLYYKSDSFAFVALKFRGRLNSLLLARAYSELPSEFDASWESYRIGGYSKLLPFRDKSGIKYFFSYGYGDCESGCMFADIYYFSIRGDSAIYHGTYSYQYPPNEPIPVWFDTFELAVTEYFRTE